MATEKAFCYAPAKHTSGIGEVQKKVSPKNDTLKNEKF